MTGRDQLIAALELLLDRIKRAAKEGQDGSANYAMDRLRMIEQYADIGLKKTTANADLTNGIWRMKMDRNIEILPAHLEPKEPFTPGPWVVNDENPRSLKVESAAYNDETPGICGNHSPQWKLTADDARLIAKAPEMVEVLEQCVAELGDENPDDDWDCLIKARLLIRHIRTGAV